MPPRYPSTEGAMKTWSDPPGGSAAERPPANAGGMATIPDPGGSRVPQSNQARGPQVISWALEPLLCSERSHRASWAAAQPPHSQKQKEMDKGKPWKRKKRVVRMQWNMTQHQTNEVLASVTRLALRVYYEKWSKSDRERQILRGSGKNKAVP